MFRRSESDSLCNTGINTDVSLVIFKNQLLFGGKAVVKEGEGFSCCGVHLAIVIIWILSHSFWHTDSKNQQIHVNKLPLICNITSMFRIF